MVRMRRPEACIERDGPMTAGLQTTILRGVRQPELTVLRTVALMAYASAARTCTWTCVWHERQPICNPPLRGVYTSGARGHAVPLCNPHVAETRRTAAGLPVPAASERAQWTKTLAPVHSPVRLTTVLGVSLSMQLSNSEIVPSQMGPKKPFG